MITVILNWLYIAITSFVTGFAVLSFFSGIFNTNEKKTIYCIWAGLVVNTVYAEFVSLFGGVGVAANIVLIVTVIVFIVFMRKEMAVCLRETLERINEVSALRYVYAIVLLLMVYGTSRGYIHVDTSIYHAQSIRWIEEYGVVKGLACLQLRFGYNSAAFALTALYSFKDLLGQSLHTTAGFFVLLGAIHTVDLYKIFTTRKVRHSDFIRLGLLFYIGLIYKEMVSPASDYYAQILIFVIIISWLDAIDENRSEYAFSMLAILAVYAATIKFSIALLVLLTIKPAVLMIKKKQSKQIISSLCGGTIVLLPFLIRNVLISGWLIYPSTFPDLFNPDWKIPKGVAEYDAMEIGLYGKGITDVTRYDTPMSEWIPTWFSQMSLIEKGWVVLTCIGLVVGTVYMIRSFAKKKIDHDKLLMWIVLVAACLFWFFSAPLVRYGYGYLTTVPLFADGLLCLEMTKKTGDEKSLYIAFLIIFAFISAYRIKTVGYDIITTAKEPYYLSQKDYIDWPADVRELNGYDFYVPKEDGMIGYDLFPSSMFVIDVQMRGITLEDGFRFSDYNKWLEQNSKTLNAQ